MENEYVYSEEFQAYGDKLTNNLSEYVTLESALLEGDAVVAEGEPTPLNSMQDFLEAPLVSDKDTAMKKLFAAGLNLAKDTAALPNGLKNGSPESIASFVDDGLTRIKVTYKTVKGEIPAEEGIDLLIDHSAARTMAIADALVKTLETNVDAICNALSMAYPPAAMTIQLLKPIIKCLVTKLSPKVKEAIHAGIIKASQHAKVAVRPAIAKTREIEAKVKNLQMNAIYGLNNGL